MNTVTIDLTAASVKALEKASRRLIVRDSEPKGYVRVLQELAAQARAKLNDVQGKYDCPACRVKFSELNERTTEGSPWQVEYLCPACGHESDYESTFEGVIS